MDMRRLKAAAKARIMEAIEDNYELLQNLRCKKLDPGVIYELLEHTVTEGKKRKRNVGDGNEDEHEGDEHLEELQ